jgi:hypothetical protein
MLLGVCDLPQGISREGSGTKVAVEAAHIYPVCSADIVKGEGMEDLIQSPQDLLALKPQASQKVEVSSGRNILFLYRPIARWFDTYKVSVTCKASFSSQTTLVFVVVDQALMNMSIHLGPKESLQQGYDLPDGKCFRDLHLRELSIPKGKSPCLRFLSSHFRFSLSQNPDFDGGNLSGWKQMADLSETNSSVEGSSSDEDGV